jgi:sodium-independent sulfate anion transporter 11
MARSGARTPFAGVFSGAIVVLALYALTPAFYYIPDAILAAVVIHAVSDLASGKAYLTELWYTSPIELSVWVCTVLVTIFVDIESSIYAAVGLSLIIMLYKMTKPPVKTLVRLSPCDEEQEAYLDKYGTKMMETAKWEVDGSRDYIYVDGADPNFQNASTDVPAGLLVFQLCDSILYPNAEHVAEHILNGVKSKTRCGNIEDLNKTDNERTWSQEVITQMEQMRMAQLPVLKTIVLDVTAVSRIDSTGIQILLTLQDSIDKYAGNNVPFHFAGIQNTSVRSALLGANFGLLPQSKNYNEDDNSSFTSQPVFLEHTSTMHNEPYYTQSETKDTTDIMYNITLNKSDAIMTSSSNTPSAPSDISFIPKDRFPCFHWDVNTAVKTICKNWHYSNAKINIEKNDENTELGSL